MAKSRNTPAGGIALSPYKSLELEKPAEYQLEGLEIGVTSSCNFRCNYCCAYKRNDGESLAAPEIIRLLEELPDLKRVRLSGGEVTMQYADTLAVVAYCGSRGIQTQLNTNGSLLTPKRIGELEKAGLNAIHISFNYLTAESFAAYYQLPLRFYDRIQDNIRACSETGFHTVLETLLFKGTMNSLNEIHDRVYELGARIHEIQNSIVMPHTGWQGILEERELKEAIHGLIARRREGMSLFFTCIDRFAERLDFKEGPHVHLTHCIEGKTQLHLHGNGDIIISELCHPVVIGNVYRDLSLRTVYQNRPKPLSDFLNKLPCPAYDSLYSE
ncbi:radical SAM protein [Paenibacillus oryzae]|uniref:radical SAM protein n=1 Tax=Paenibacillus oryzae TaxID=1844972 RepID=UPI003CCC1DDD